MEKLIPAAIKEGKSCPVFAKGVDINLYTVEEEDSSIAQQACAINMSYLVTRQTKETHPSWSVFNQSLSKKSTESAAITTSKTLYVHFFANRTRIHGYHS